VTKFDGSIRVERYRDAFDMIEWSGVERLLGVESASSTIGCVCVQRNFLGILSCGVSVMMTDEVFRVKSSDGE
jgi:hypothetical protein